MGKRIGAEDNFDGLRILMVAPQPFFRPRGTPFSVLHRIRALLAAGNTVDLVTYPFGEDIEFDGLRIFRSGRPPLIRDVKIGPSIGKIFLDVFLYFKVLSLLRRQHYDVVHSHEEAAFFVIGLARRYGMKHVYDMHSSLPHQLKSFQAFDITIFRSIFTALEKRVLQTCDGIITICSELEDIATRDCGDTPQMMIENTGDDSKVFGREVDDLRAKYNLADKPIALYTGTFEPYQGLDLLLEAFAVLLSSGQVAHLLMVGGHPLQVKHYTDIAHSLSLQDHVTFVGSVHPSRIPSFLEATDVIVSPRSKGEYTPLKIYNYMRSGRPIVATDLPTHTQTLDSTVACLVSPTPDGLAAGMRRIFDNPEIGKRLARCAAQWTEENYSDENYLAKVSELYRQVFNGPLQNDADRITAAVQG